MVALAARSSEKKSSSESCRNVAAPMTSSKTTKGAAIMERASKRVAAGKAGFSTRWLTKMVRRVRTASAVTALCRGINQANEAFGQLASGLLADQFVAGM